MRAPATIRARLVGLVLAFMLPTVLAASFTILYVQPADLLRALAAD